MAHCAGPMPRPAPRVAPATTATCSCSGVVNSPLYVGEVASDVDIEGLGLLDGLDGQAREERAELVAWLLDQDFSVERIRKAISAMLLPAGRVIGDDGTYVSAREICAETGIDMELLKRLQRAFGLPRVDDPDVAVYLRADGEAAARAKLFVDVGLRPDQVVTVARVLGDGLAQAAEVMRQAALEAVLQPGVTELQIAQAYEALVRQISPLLGPMIEDLLRLQLRHSLETEAVNAAERAAGTLPGARQVAVAFADLVGFTRLGEAVPAEEHRARRVTPTSDDADQLWRGTRTGRQAHRWTVTSATRRKRISPNASGMAPQLAPECCDGLQVCWRFVVMSLCAHRSQPNRHVGARRGRQTPSGSIVLSGERKLHHADASEAH